MLPLPGLRKPADGSEMSADDALQLLKDGHQRFLHGTARFPALRTAALADLAFRQTPFATILGCSDSRVPPELVFDAGFGELFVIRVAGNILSPEVAGSMQYAGLHLATPLFVVLGHEGCGAVKAALASKDHGATHASRIQVLVDAICPALTMLDDIEDASVRLSRAVEANVRRTIALISDSPEGQKRMAEGRMKVVGAVYELSTGRIRWVD
jgi:carbonic anhydrase